MSRIRSSCRVLMPSHGIAVRSSSAAIRLNPGLHSIMLQLNRDITYGILEQEYLDSDVAALVVRPNADAQIQK